MIPAFEMVMRAKDNVYHLECFACQQCNHRLVLYVFVFILFVLTVNLIRQFYSGVIDQRMHQMLAMQYCYIGCSQANFTTVCHTNPHYV